MNPAGSAERTKELNIYAPIPGAHHAFRSATTALCVSALLDVNASRPEVSKAIDRGEAWLLEHLPTLRRAEPAAIYNVWGHAFAIQALVKLYNYRSGDTAKQAELKKQIEQQIEPELFGRAKRRSRWIEREHGSGSQPHRARDGTQVRATRLILIVCVHVRDLTCWLASAQTTRVLALVRA